MHLDPAVQRETISLLRASTLNSSSLARQEEPTLVPLPRRDYRDDSRNVASLRTALPTAQGPVAGDGEPPAVSAANLPIEDLTRVSSAMVISDGGGGSAAASSTATRKRPGKTKTGKTKKSKKARKRPSASARAKTLRVGSRGPAVVELQRLLSAAGFSPGPADGVFGSNTQAAVRRFQRGHGLTADGIVGPKTWGAFGTKTKKKGKNPPGRETSGRVAKFLRRALAQKGDRYIFGAETNLKDFNPKAFDCSELVQWACAQAGVKIPDGSWNQKAFCKRISVAEAMRTPGALLFTDGHVAISLGNGRTIEARGSAWGVGSWPAAGRFTSGGLIPGMKYG